MLVHITICADVVGKMRRSGRVITMLAVLIILLALFSTINTNALSLNQKKSTQQIIVVDKNNDEDFNSIQKAINYASSGTKILVKSGRYEEIIDVKKNIYLVGEDKKDTILCPISNKNKYAVRLGARNIKMENFGIVNRAPGLYTTGIKITAPDIEIENCDIYETPVGIAVWSSDSTIKNCEFRYCEDEGIALLGWKGHESNNNKIIDCLFYKNCDGIELQYSSNNIIKNCEFYENTHTGIDAIASSNDNNRIESCKIVKNEVNGIYFSSSSDNRIIDCEISDNKDGDIYMNKYSKNNLVISSNENDKSNEEKNDEISLWYILKNFREIDRSELRGMISRLSF